MTQLPPPEVTPASFEILAVRELRKAGFEVTDPRVHRRTELSEPERGFLLELRVWLQRSGWQKRALIACRRQESVVARAALDDLAARLASAQADVGLLFASADFAPDALVAAEEGGIALLRLVDARTAFDTGGWGDPGGGHYPSWLPAYLVQLVDRDQTGQVRYRLLEGGCAGLIVDRLERKETPHG